jgi:hypothetical protein
MHNICCGGSGADIRPGSGMYGGVNTAIRLEWVGAAAQIGFVAAEVTTEEMIIQYIDTELAVMKEVHIPRRSAAEKLLAHTNS